MDKSQKRKRYSGRFTDPTGKVWWGNSWQSYEAAKEDARLKWCQSLSSLAESGMGNTVHDVAKKLYYPVILSKSENTLKVYWRDCYKKYIEPAIGQMPYAEVRKIDIVNMIAKARTQQGKVPSASTIENIIIVARGIFNELVENRYLDTNPVVGSIKAPPRPPKKELTITESDVRIAAGTCPPHMVPVLLLGSALGLRRGEIAALKWEDISGTTIYIQRQRLKSGNYSLPKGGRVRKFEVSEEFLAELQSVGNQDSGYVCTNLSGQPWSLSALDRDFRELGIGGTHTLRHLTATRVAQKNVLAAQKLLGHASLATTMGYTHEENVSTADVTSVYPSVVKWVK